MCEEVYPANSVRYISFSPGSSYRIPVGKNKMTKPIRRFMRISNDGFDEQNVCSETNASHYQYEQDRRGLVPRESYGSQGIRAYFFDFYRIPRFVELLIHLRMKRFLCPCRTLERNMRSSKGVCLFGAIEIDLCSVT
jgi:hypothetical protein